MSRSDLRLAALAAALASVGACDGTAPPTGRADAMVVVQDRDGTSHLARRALPFDDLTTLAGEHLVFERADALVADDATLTIRIEGGGPVRLSLVRDGDGVYHAGDYEALVALSAAHHLEAARAHFLRLGAASAVDPVTPWRVVLYPKDGDGVPRADNAFFAQAVGGFGVLRERLLEDLPLAMNGGIMAHEYAHAAFERLTRPKLDELGVPSGGTPSILVPLNEGLADVHAAVASGNPDFIRLSVGEDAALLDPNERDLRVRRVATFETLFSTNPYALGSVVASAMYRYGRELGDDFAPARLAYDTTVRFAAKITARDTDLYRTFVLASQEVAREAGHAEVWQRIVDDQLRILVEREEIR